MLREKHKKSTNKAIILKLNKIPKPGRTEDPTGLYYTFP